MSDFQSQLEPLRFWNRAAILAFMGALPVAGGLAFATSGSALGLALRYLEYA